MKALKTIASKILHKIKYYFALTESIWFTILGIVGMIVCVNIMIKLFGVNGVDAYPISGYLVAFVAVPLVSIAINAARLILYYNFRKIHNHIWGYKDEKGEVVYPMLEDWKNLKPCQRFFASLLLVLVFFFSGMFAIFQLI